jgi:hypothetical protein
MAAPQKRQGVFQTPRAGGNQGALGSRAAEAGGAAAASERSEGASSQGGGAGGGTPPPQRYFSDLRGRGGAFTALNCELARFAKCSEQLREATYLAKSSKETSCIGDGPIQVHILDICHGHSSRAWIGTGTSVVFWSGYAIWWGHPGAELGCFFRLPGRGVHLGGAASKWGGRGRPVGHAAVPPAVRR